MLAWFKQPPAWRYSAFSCLIHFSYLLFICFSNNDFVTYPPWLDAVIGQLRCSSRKSCLFPRCCNKQCFFERVHRVSVSEIVFLKTDKVTECFDFTDCRSSYCEMTISVVSQSFVGHYPGLLRCKQLDSFNTLFVKRVQFQQPTFCGRFLRILTLFTLYASVFSFQYYCSLLWGCLVVSRKRCVFWRNC